MIRVTSNNLKEQNQKLVEIVGFVDNIRDLKKFQFIILRDSKGLVQLFVEKSEENTKINETISLLPKESVVSASGIVRVDDHIKLNQVEIQLKDLKVLSRSLPELPIDEKSPLNLELDWRFLSLRRPKNHLIFKVQTTIEHAMREWWIKHHFTEIHSPKLMGTASETGAELFELPYFGTTAYLAQSPQFYKQMAIAAGFDKVFEIGPVFRANSSHTRRHDTEFTSVDVEIAWIESHEEVMQLQEKWLQFVLKELKNKYGEEIKELFGVEIEVPNIPFPRITLSEARNILKEMGHIIDHKSDLDPEGEKLIAKYIKEQYHSDFVFITEYPTSVRAFYHMRKEDNPEVTKSFDLIGKGIEITTGAQREHRPEKLISQAKEKGYDLEPLNDYFHFFKYGCPPHGGFGFGLTRLIMILLELDNVREATFLYRGPNRLTP